MDHTPIRARAVRIAAALVLVTGGLVGIHATPALAARPRPAAGPRPHSGLAWRGW